ncbi:unnamed protein product [Candida verbasci]|uniref:Uncharacterized protein n=1 Tax=Candida verbasci TaxID=1227364 RepID=A0A9W4X9S3_9ASCO|nr:unnamed protein product [Candida verbasci]
MNPFKKQKRDNDITSDIDRSVLNFDLEKICSVKLTSNNIYCCLKCGKFFEGRSNSSPAYNHFIQTFHSKYLNLTTKKFYTLPEKNEIETTIGLQDIIENLEPRYKKEDIETLPRISFDLNDKKYMVGYVGLHNVNNSDYLNVIIQMFAHVKPIRDYYLLYESETNNLENKLALLIKKIWSPLLFKSQVSPVELVNSLKKDFHHLPKQFLVWLLNKGHFQNTFQGSIEITTIPIDSHELNNKVEFIRVDNKKKLVESKFWLLSLNVPLNTLHENNKRVDLQDLMIKYSGEEVQEEKCIKIYKITKLPKYLIISFEKSQNSAIVNFPETLKVNSSNYQLISSIKKADGWSISLKTKEDTWLDMKDTKVESTKKDLLHLSDNYIQVWELI